MDVLWLVLGTVFVAVVWTARSIVKSWECAPVRNVRALPPLRPNSTKSLQSNSASRRVIRAISMQECESLVHSADDVIFIVVRAVGDRGPLPFPEMHALAVVPGQLADELRWLPSASCVVLCGAVNLCASELGSLAGGLGSRQIYILRQTSAQSEVA